MNTQRKILILIALLLNSANYFSQTNGSFENWTTVTSGTLTYQDPDNWQTFNFIAPYGNPVTAFRASGVDAYSGSYALKLKTGYFPNKFGINFPDTLGITFNGKILIAPPSYKIGTPYTIRSQILQFYSKYIPVGSDTGVVVVSLSRHLTSGRDTIAKGVMNVLPNGSYSFYQIPLVYFSNATPDSASIVFGSSKNSSIGRVGSTIYIDDVLFTGTVPIGIKENEAYQSIIKLYPNPASEFLEIGFLNEELFLNNTPLTLNITNASGQTLQTTPLQKQKTKISVSELPSGIYLFNVYDKKNKLLTTGKFNLVK